MATNMWLPTLALVLWFGDASAFCSPVKYSSKSQCEEALASDAKTNPACSTIDFNKQVPICELRSRTDLDALRSGRRVLPGLPVNIEW